MPSETPSFLAFGAPTGDVTYDFPTQVAAYVRSLAGTTGCNLLVSFIDADGQHTRRQEKGFHAMIAPWVRKRGDNRPDDLKQWLLAEIFGTHVFVDEKTGVEFQVLAEPSTSRLTKAQYSHLIERTMDLAAERDMILVAPDEWRALKEAERRKLARAAKR